MATAAEAATAAASAAPAEATEETPAADTGQGDQESTETAAETAAAGGAPAKSKPPSELVKLAKANRALERKLAELTAAKATPAPKTDEKPVTRESILADLKKAYEEDPEAFLEQVAGEDFVTLAGRLAKREETAKAPASKIERLERELAALKAERDGEKTEKASADAKAMAAQHIATVQKEIETVGEDGEPRYPNLVSLDPEVLDEPVAVTAYKAVERAYLKECCDKDGKVIPGRKWTPAQQTERFNAAFKALDTHYGKLRTPKTPNTPRAEEPEPPSPTISKHNSSGHVDPPARRAPGTLTVREALRQALKEHGIQQ